MHKPLTTFGNVKADVLALKDPTYKRLNFCSIILGSSWVDDRKGCVHCDDPSHKHG
jgi:hypothetical protein